MLVAVVMMRKVTRASYLNSQAALAGFLAACLLIFATTYFKGFHWGLAGCDQQASLHNLLQINKQDARLGYEQGGAAEQTRSLVTSSTSARGQLPQALPLLTVEEAAEIAEKHNAAQLYASDNKPDPPLSTTLLQQRDTTSPDGDWNQVLAELPTGGILSVTFTNNDYRELMTNCECDYHHAQLTLCGKSVPYPCVIHWAVGQLWQDGAHHISPCQCCLTAGACHGRCHAAHACSSHARKRQGHLPAVRCGKLPTGWVSWPSAGSTHGSCACMPCAVLPQDARPRPTPILTQPAAARCMKAACLLACVGARRGAAPPAAQGAVHRRRL